MRSALTARAPDGRAPDRLIVVIVNVLFGTLSGLQPLLPPGSVYALGQASLILMLQLGMLPQVSASCLASHFIRSSMSSARHDGRWLDHPRSPEPEIARH